MASKIHGPVKKLGIFEKPTKFSDGLGALLPEAYKKFYKEWKLTEPTAVHYIPEPGRWKRDDVTGEVLPIQNVPIPVFYPPEHNKHMWGGEGVVQGFQVRDKFRRRVPHFWVPVLKRSVVHSEVLDKYMAVVVTDRTIRLINENFGFDHYLLKTPACDLKSLMALGLKRKILEELQKGCPIHADRPDRQQALLNTYKKYLSAYTSEEIKWYGYSFSEACRILQQQLDEEAKPTPLKHSFRAQLVEKLKAAVAEQDGADVNLEIGPQATSGSWLQKINPFGKKHET